MKVLVTGGRAPASMDIMRSLIHQGYTVYSADSMNFPLGRFVKGLKQHYTLPKPNSELKQFINALKTIILEDQIDLLIPTCEEILYVSQGYEELSKHTRLLCEPFVRLNTLHNKFIFNQMALDCGLDAPRSWLLTTDEDKAKIPVNQDIILKPIYSRFGSHLIIKPSPQALKELKLNVPYVAQLFLTGKEYCSYAIAEKGKVLVQTAYHPKYTSGPAAGIYFEPANIEAINHFVNVFCQKYQFSGQIAFDFIVREGKAFVLECNPRITSGFHLVSDQINWSTLLEGQIQHWSIPQQPYMLGLAMKLQGFNYFLKNPKAFIKDYKLAHDVLKNKAYPWLGLKSFMTIANIFFRMIKEKKNFHSASTDDIEYNGECEQ